MIAKTFTVNSTPTRKLQSHFKPIYAEMAAAAAPAPADGAPAPDPAPDPAPAPARPPPKGAGLTKLCPSCGVRRPTFHFIRRNGKSLRNLVMNCATCRGFRPRDPRIAVNNADGGDADGDGKQFQDTIFNPLEQISPIYCLSFESFFRLRVLGQVMAIVIVSLILPIFARESFCALIANSLRCSRCRC